jgi:tetratricopeptide (TPR) repeat protein
MRLARWLLFLACLSQAATAWGATPVGSLGNPEHLVMTGVKAFSSEQIRDALRLNSAFGLAADTAAPLDEYLKTIDRLISAGYRHAGFPDVKVTVSVDARAHKIAANVKEGPCYLAGDVRIHGDRTIPVAELIGRLREPHPPKDAVAQSWTECKGKATPCWTDRQGNAVELCDPVWCPGKPAQFLTTPETDSDLHREVADALADLGYFFARFFVAIVTDRATKKAHLVVAISNEGVRSLLGSVDVAGNAVNSRDEILTYLSFRPETAATRGELVRLQNKLWHSGRFIKSEVTLFRPATAADKAGLRIDVVELHGATPLRKPLSREEEVFLKCRDWLANAERWDGDLMLQGRDSEGSTTVVSAPAKGLFVEVKYDRTPPRKPAEYAAILSPKEIGLYCISGGRKLATRPLTAQLIGSMALRLNDNANSNDNANEKHGRATFALGWGIKPNRLKSKSALDLYMVFEPALFVDMAHWPGARYTVRDGILNMSAENDTLRVDVASGKLLEYLIITPDNNASKRSRPPHKEASGTGSADQPQSTMRLSFVREEFRRRLEAVNAATAKAPNAYDAHRLISSLLRFVGDEEMVWQALGVAEDRHVWNVLRRMLDEKVCEPFDKLASKLLAISEVGTSNDSRDDFSIPEPGASPLGSYQNFTQGAVSFSFAVARRSFPSGSWPELVSREALMAACGCHESTVGELKKVYESEQRGPLCFLVTGALFESVNPSLATVMLCRGLERLSAADFRKEYPILLDPKYPLGQCAHRMAASLRKLDDRDVQALSTLLPEKSAAAFRRWVSDLHRDPKLSVDLAIPALLDAFWQSGLREHVKAALETLQGYSSYFAEQANSDETIAQATEALRLNVKVAETYKIRAWAHASKQENDQAIADYTEVLQLGPKDGWTHYTRGTAYERNGCFDKAIADYTKAIRVDPKNMQAYYYARARAYGQKLDYDNAIADYTEVLRVWPQDATAHWGRGVAYQQKGEQERVVSNFQMPNALTIGNAGKSILLGPKAPHAWEAISEEYFDKAIADYTEAIRLNPKLAEAYWNRASVYQERGNNTQAIKDMAEARKLGVKLR